MKFQKKVKFLLPYLNSVKDIIPPRKIAAIKGYKVSNKKRELQYGNCLKDINGRHTINLRLYFWDEKDKRYYTLFLGHILETFAHELAHAYPGCYNHSPKHMKYTGIILARFEKVLLSQKIKDTYKTRMSYE